MLQSLRNQTDWLKAWVVTTRFIAFTLSFCTLYTIFVLIPRFLYFLWLPSESGRINMWIFQSFFFRGGLWLAFMITFSIYTFFSVRSVGKYLWARYIPPHDINRDTSLPLPVTYRSIILDLRRSKKVVVNTSFLTTIALAFLLYVHLTYFHLNTELITEYIRKIPETSLFPALFHMLQIPINAFYTRPIGEMNDPTLFNTLVYFWIPSIPFAIIMTNVHNILYRIIRLGAYEMGKSAVTALTTRNSQ